MISSHLPRPSSSLETSFRSVRSAAYFLCENSRATCDRYFLFFFFFLLQDSWYEFRVMAVMVDLISESSNVVGVSSTGWLPCKKVHEIMAASISELPLAATARSLPTGGVA